MKTFSTYQKINNLQPCMKKPVVVDCLQMGTDFRVDSLEGDYKQGKPGDYLMRGVDGELYICDREVFEKTYEIYYEM